MKYRFLTVLHNMNLESKKNKGTILFPGARLTNGSAVLSLTLNNRLMRSTLGVHSIDEFEEKDTVYAYIDGEFKDIHTQDEMDEIGVKYTFLFLRQIQKFVHQLWEIKDNNIYVRDGFLLTYSELYEDGCTYKASLSEVFSRSTCEREVSIISDSEISAAIKDFIIPTMKDLSEEGGKHPTSDHFFKSKGSTRMERAYYFTIVARSNGILPMKIVSYTNALECLFTIGTSEINHKMAERVAIMLGTTEESKKKYYKLIKNAYKYRSSLVHGQHIKGNNDDLVKISTGLDNVVRQLLISNHEVFTKNDSEMEDYFINLLFN